MATCKECLHHDVCKKFNEVRTKVINESNRGAENLCEVFVDRSRFIEMPCKEGEKVWVIRNHRGIHHPREGIVSNIYVTDRGIGVGVKNIGRGIFGIKVFLTREEAEAALAERRGNEQKTDY